MNLFHTLSCMFSPYQIASDIDITTRQTLFNDDQLLFFCFFSPTTLTILYDIWHGGKIEFSLFYTKQLQTQHNWTNKLKQHHSIQQCIGQTLSRHTHTHISVVGWKKIQVFHHSQAISVRPTSAKPMWYYNGRNQFIPMKISFTTNFIGMIRMQMKRTTSKCSRFHSQFNIISCDIPVMWFDSFVNGNCIFTAPMLRIDDYLLNKIFDSTLQWHFSNYPDFCFVHSFVRPFAFAHVLAVSGVFLLVAIGSELNCCVRCARAREKIVDVSQILNHINWRVCIRTHCITYGWQLDLNVVKVQRHHRFQYEPNNTVSYHITFLLVLTRNIEIEHCFLGRASS